MKKPRKSKLIEDLSVRAESLLVRQEVAENMASAGPPELPDPKIWIKTNLVIQRREGGEELFDNWRYGQEKVMDIIIEWYFIKKLPLILVLHKIRQVAGASTIIQAWIFFLLHFLPERQGLVAAHEADATSRVFNNVIRFYHYLSEEEKKLKPVLGGKAHQSGLRYDFPHNSQFHVVTAGSPETARSGKYNYWHMSEYAFFLDPSGFVKATLGADTTDITSDSFGCYESTANGPNDFKDLIDWAADDKHKPPYHFEFLSWTDEPDCKMQVPKDFEFEQKEIEYAEIVEKESGVIITPEQMAWHRWKRGVYRGSWPMMKQEFPSFSKEAFDYTGEPWFDLERCRLDLENAPEPMFIGELKWASKTLPIIRPMASDNGHLAIWEHPIPGEHYVLGGDYGYGINVKSDFSEIIVFHRDSGRMVAHYRNNLIQTEHSATLTFMIGAYYNFALAGVEWNMPGQAVLDGMRKEDRGDSEKMMQGGYPHLYYDQPTRIDNPRENNPKVGFSTRKDTKADIMNHVQNDYREGRILIPSKTLLLQMSGWAFSWAKQTWIQNHKDPDTRNYNDDGVMALAIANKIRRVALGADCTIKDKVAAYG